MQLGACQHPSQPRRRGKHRRALDSKNTATALAEGGSGGREGAHPQPPLRQAAVGPLLCFAEQSHEERFRQDQMGRRIYLMRHWSPRSDPTLGILLLVLHLTLLLRLALAGSSGGGSSGAAWGFELLPFPLAGAYLAWLQLRMTRRWAVGWVQVRSLVLAASQLLLAVSAALSTPVLAAAALGVASQAGTPAQQASTPLAQLASTACQLAGSTVQLTARGAKLLDAATGGKLLSSAPLAAWARAAAAVQQGGGRLLGMVGMPAPMWGTLGVWRVLLSELTDSWVLLFVMLPHLAGQPLAVAVGVQLAAAALNAATCKSTCSVLLQGRPSLQRLYIEAGSALEDLTSPLTVPAAGGLPRGWGGLLRPPCCNGNSSSGIAAAAAAAAPAVVASQSAAVVDPAALGTCCALRTFAWLACACVFSLRLLYRRELQGRLAWAQRQRWCPEALVQELRWRVVPACVAVAELALACSLAWHVASLHMLPLHSAPPGSSPSQGS